MSSKTPDRLFPVLFAVIALLGLLIALSQHLLPPPTHPVTLTSAALSPRNVGSASPDLPARRMAPRLPVSCAACDSSREICKKYGSRNLQRSRVYDGSGERTQKVMRKALEGRGLTLAVIGGSATLGLGCEGRRYHDVVFRWMQTRLPHPDNKYADGSIGARGSSYFKYCHPTLIPQDADIILLETSVNDWKMGDESFDNAESLLRSLLEYPSQPLVILVHTFKIDGFLATGADSQLGLANFYDVPVISSRPVFLPKILADHSVAADYFAMTADGERLDTVHPNCWGHRALGDSIVAYLEEARCRAMHPVKTVLPADPALILQPESSLALPRQRLGQRYDVSIRERKIEPTCLSLDRKSNVQMVPSVNVGWDLWQHPKNAAKTFWRAEKAGSRISFEVATTIGEVTIYALRSGSADYNLGNAKCWIDDLVADATIIQGYWTAPYSHGWDMPIKTKDLPAGKHTLICEVLEHTSNPNGGHNFLLIAVFPM